MVQPNRHPQTLVDWMEGLADRTRLRLLRLLERHELGVVELCDVLQLPQSTVSRHLKILSDQGWLSSRRTGTTHLYRTILDELDPAARKLWLVAREQTDDWAQVHQDELRLLRRLRHRETSSQTFFASAAGKWDKLRRELYGESFTTAAMLALLPSDYIVADLGCGTGQVTAVLADHVKQVIGVDSSAAMLKSARKRLGDRANVELLRGDLNSVPIPDAKVNAVTLMLVLTYVVDLAPVLREVARILQPGGKVVIVDLLPHDRDDFRRQFGHARLGIEPKELERHMSEAGLQHSKVQSLPPEPRAKGPALFLGIAQKH